MSVAAEKGVVQVALSSQSKRMVGAREVAEGPRREVKRTGMFASWSREARRKEVFPVPPVRRMVMVILDDKDRFFDALE